MICMCHILFDYISCVLRWTSVQHGSSNRSVHSFSMEDDSFAELGPPVTERAVSQLKLATEKPERFIVSRIVMVCYGY